MEDNFRQAFTTLFSRASERGGFEFVHTLVRTSTYDCRPIEDPFLRIKRRLGEQPEGLADEQAAALYCELATDPTALEVIANLLRCEKEEPYRIFPFGTRIPEPAWRHTAERAAELVQQLEETGHAAVAEAIRGGFTLEALQSCSDGGQADLQACVRALETLRPFLAILIEVYESTRAAFRDAPRYQRYPLGVVEFLVNDKSGLYGWKLHRPHRATSHFERLVNGMDNYMFDDKSEIVPVASQLEPPGGPWLVNGRRLHELGLKGRYNLPGQWQPILYPGWQEDLTALVDEVVPLSFDADVLGGLFYIYATGYRSLEFVVRTRIDLPYESGTVGDRIHLWKCPPQPGAGAGERLYDGWVELESVEPEYIRAAVAAVGVVLNRLAFAYDASLAWRVKYRLVPSGEPLAKPSAADIDIFNRLLIDFPEGSDAILLEASLDWYRQARASTNPFSAFFGYYVAVERIAAAIYDGRADFGLGNNRRTKGERREERMDCIQRKFDELYSTNPQKFVTEAYFDCVVGLGKKVREVTDLVFGEKHPYVVALFEKDADGYSLSNIRSEIAHGSLSQADRDHLAIISRQLPAMAEVAKEFLARLCFGKKAGEVLPGWSREYIDERSHTDPRTLIATGDPEFIFSNDWTIQPHWCDA